MWAVFQSSGTVPESKDFWNITVSTVWISSAHIFNKLPGMLSGPGALFTLILVRSFKTPCGFIVILEILQKGCASSGYVSKGGLGLENTLENCLLKRSAFCFGSVTQV